MKRKKVLLAFSGGIDSVHAARILINSGYDVEALTLNTTGDEAMISNARFKAAKLGIGFNVADVRKQFKERIIDYFISEYVSGRTPAPCTLCNYAIKWETLFRTAIEGGYDHIATGHYFGITSIGGKYFVRKASDVIKDQSYYLWMLPQRILSMALTPMADQIKSTVKEGLHADEPKVESMGICFLRGKDYGSFIRQHYRADIPSGEISDNNGTVIGLHEGLPFYTIGQKRGIPSDCGLCVTKIDAPANRVIVGDKNELLHNTLIVSDLVSPDMDLLFKSNDINVKIRGFGRNPEGYCDISPLDNGLYKIILDEPAWAPAPGQPIVLYKGDMVVGGGFLEESCR